MSTYRERREARAERLRGWADGRDAKASAAYNASNAIGEHIPMGQPILVGHHSERRHRRDIARMHGHMDKTVEHGRMADRHRSRADNIDRQAANAIYSDDPDAIERLDEKIATLEAERDRVKAFNAACRKAKGVTDEALALLDDKQRKDYLWCVGNWAHTIGAYGTQRANTNLGANIRRLKKRREHIHAQSGRA